MRYRAMLTLAIAGMFILATAAVTQANWYHKSEGSGGSTSEMTSPSAEPEALSTEPGDYANPQELETGSLPSPSDPHVPSVQFSPGGEPIPVIDQGGLMYRVGIDTGA